MPYITVPLSPAYHQITLEEILAGKTFVGPIRDNANNTRTYYTERDGSEMYDAGTVEFIIQKLEEFVERHADLYKADRHSLYHKFFIPKKSGGLREINAPVPALMDALNELKGILQNYAGAMYHTAAFAYVKGRSTIDAVKKHQFNNSHWFMKVDFHDFFGSTTQKFTLGMLTNIVPFNLVSKSPRGQTVLGKAMDLCFLDGGLPQGTPISPMLTNLLMIPVDFVLSNKLRSYNNQKFVYTRYADDMLISSGVEFKSADIQNLIREVLKQFDAPYTFKEEKTRYGSRSGANWNLGVMLNKDNEITVGHAKKKAFRAMINNYVLDKKHNKSWPVEDVQTMSGLLSYYKMIEPEYFTGLLQGLSVKYQFDIKSAIKADLKL